MAVIYLQLVPVNQAISAVVKNVVQSKAIAQQSTNVTHSLSFRVNFSYRIGKLTVEKTERKKKSISNDDLKGSKD